MKRIEEIDENLKLNTNIQKDDIKFYNVTPENFDIYGIFFDDLFRRVPKDVADMTNEGVKGLARCTAGGRLWMKTDTDYIALLCNITHLTKLSHMPLRGSGGFDIYADGAYVGSITPNFETVDYFEGIVEFKDGKKVREIEIVFPLYNTVAELKMGLSENAVIGKCDPYKYNTPVVFYGSSITQGGCASRGGNCYQEILSKRLGFDYINLGFSGSAKGEKIMADYIATLDMSVFVFDYDHNAPTAEHLRDTHEPFFKTVREKHPHIPVIFISKPDFKGNDDDILRREIIMTTYKNALDSGDENVWFIDGEKLWGETERDLATVDGCHPNDIGFLRMANGIESSLKEALLKTETQNL